MSRVSVRTGGVALLRVSAMVAVFVMGSYRAASASAWDGSWTLDIARSSVGADRAAAPGYAFAVTDDGHITWRIPALGEVVEGRTDGRPMVVHRRTPTPGMTLSVRADGPYTLHYQVARDGVVRGEGLMRIVEGGRAWVDLSWSVANPEAAGALVYVRQTGR